MEPTKHSLFSVPYYSTSVYEYLSYVTEKSTRSTYADDTQIFYADNDPSRIEETINNDLGSADKWFAQNGMTRNSSKYQIMVLGKNKGTELAFKV